MRLMLALGLIVIAPVFRIQFALHNWDMLWKFSFITNADSMMIGSLSAMALAEDRGKLLAWLNKSPSVGRAISLAAIYLIWILDRKSSLELLVVPLGVTIQAAAAAYLIASYAVVRSGLGYQLLNLRTMRYIGMLSYSWYMWQQPFFAPTNIYGYTEPPICLIFPFNIVASLAVAALSYHALEMPLVALRKRCRATADELPHNMMQPASRQVAMS
jgi:peptidoglycan/LPS O-acetylase OafA/YrhL